MLDKVSVVLFLALLKQFFAHLPITKFALQKLSFKQREAARLLESLQLLEGRSEPVLLCLP